MKSRRLRVLAWFIVGLIALDALVAGFRGRWDRYDPDDYREKLRACRRRQWDLLIVGGSPVCEGLDPAIIAGVAWYGKELQRAYNLGLPGATTSEVWHAVRHAVTAPPRLLLYGVTATDLNDSRLEPHGPAVLMDWRDLAEWVSTRPRTAEWTTRHFLNERLRRVWQLYYYRNAIRLWLADAADRAWPGVAPHAAAEARRGLALAAALRRSDGFAPREGFVNARLDLAKAAGHAPEAFAFLDKYRVGEHLRYLRRMLDWAAAGGTEVVLVDMPVAADLEDRLRVAEFAAYRAALAGLERERNVRVLRASRVAVGLTDADFADCYHLNAAGAAKLSGWLRARLADLSTGAALAKALRLQTNRE